MMNNLYVTIYPLSKKSDVLREFTHYVQDIKMSSGTTIKVLRRDNVREQRHAGMDRFWKSS